MTATSGPLRSSYRARRQAALRAAHEAAFPPGQFVGQESYLPLSAIVGLAEAAGVTAESEVLEPCCGVGEASLCLVERTGCQLLGLDAELDAVRLAVDAAAARGLSGRARFVAADVYRLPTRATFDVVLLFETMISIEDKPRALAELRERLRPGGRLVVTLEEGVSLLPAERGRLPGGDVSWVVSERRFLEMLDSAGFRVLRREDYTATQAEVAGRLAAAIREDHDRIVKALGSTEYEAARASAEQWREWLGVRRVRKLAFVAKGS